MNNSVNSSKTVLVTGANSGLGFETARQLADSDDWQRIVLSARSAAKAQSAVERLVSLTERPEADFETLIVDLAEPDSVDAALEDIAARDLHFDALVLNAGGVASSDSEGMRKAASGLTQLFAMNLGGHARLVEALIDEERIRDGATLVYAASEMSRGIPSMRAKPPSLPESPANTDEALWAIATGAHVGSRVDDMHEYGLVKLLGVAWVQTLARRHGRRLRALAISPGATTGTQGSQGLPFLLGLFMKWIAMPLMQLFGKAHSVSRGAARYLQGLEDASFVNGGFYASPGGGTTGALTLQSADAQPLLESEELVNAVGRLIARVSRSSTTLPSGVSS